MATIAAKLAALLESVNRPGDFFVSGTIEMMAPRLAVDGVGTIGLPLLPIQAEQLVTAAERAPYGRGEDTVVDTKVRRTWQIGSERVRITGKHWGQTLDAILARVAGGWGLAWDWRTDYCAVLQVKGEAQRFFVGLKRAVHCVCG